MTYPLSDADRAIQDRARTFVDDQLIPWEEHAEEHEGRIPDEDLRRHHELAIQLGFYGMNLPTELGGGGYTVLQQTLVSEQLGRVTNALGWCVHTPAGWAPEVMTDEQIERWLKPAIRGERRECYAITEAGAGSDVDAIASTARRDGPDYVLTGEKMHVTSYNTADHIFFQAKLAGGEHDGEHAMFVVDKDTPGVRLVREPRYSHTYADTHAIVAFEDVCCGAAERLIEEATAFAKERIQFGVPIVEHQAIGHMLADSLTELWAARLMTYRVAEEIDAGVDVKIQHAQCSMAKLFASEMAGRVSDRAVQIFGGRGYMRENVAERFHRELRVDRIWEGTSEIQRNIVADQLRKRGVRALT
ncbi:MAG: acyl-CoA dehydrogenase [Actinobacteria bacterium]|nr:MAG: acyl-CoA dehydrogenase [Actinomycetota bacterium]